MTNLSRPARPDQRIRDSSNSNKTPLGTKPATQASGNLQNVSRPAQFGLNKKTRVCPPKKHTDTYTKQESTTKQFKNLNFSGTRSNLQLTVQNLEFPDVNIKRTDLHKRDDCGKGLVTEKTAVDFESSSNSHFRNGIETVKFRKGKCTSTSSDSIDGSGSASQRESERLSARLEGFVQSDEMIDSQHKQSDLGSHFKSEEWAKPCPGSYVAGAPKSHIGVCPENYEQLAKYSAQRQKFFLTQDPRKTHCLTNPQALRHKTLNKHQAYKLITETVEQADNVCGETKSEKSDSYLCEVIDLENPLNLDFQGMDYKINYQQDEQEAQNQLVYWRVTRYMDRRRVKQQTQGAVEEELKKERLAIPPAFATKIKDEPLVEETPVKSPRLSELYRCVDKPANKQKIKEEQNRRAARYKDIYLRNKQRTADQEQLRKKQEAAARETEARNVAEMDLRNDVAIIDDAIERSFRKHVEIKQVVRKRKFFPKTIAETNRLKKIMHKENCIRRDKAYVKQQFFLERTGKLKKFPDAELKLACEGSINESVGSTPSEQSSDDEDYLDVGKKGDYFQLRGFHFKHGDYLRGKLHRHQIMQGQRTVKGCLTREEWLNQLAPKKQPIKLDVEAGIIKVRDPDDPNLNLFPPVPIIKERSDKKSAVHEFISQDLGLHYHRQLRKNLKFVKPKLKYNVKKFNLIRYVFPEKPLQNLYDTHEEEVDTSKVNTTEEYIEIKRKIEEAQHHKEKMARMQLMGLPCVDTIKDEMQSPCDQQGEDFDPDWVPTPEPEYNMADSSVPQSQQDIRLPGGERVPIEKRGNMPAPKFREKTFVQNPHRRRDYETERVPSAQFHEAIKTSGMPMLEKLVPDKIEFANVRSKKRPYTHMFEARHHHDHWHPTHSKTVHVHYQTKTVYPEITRPHKKVKKDAIQFIKANPPCKKYLNVDLTKQEHDFDKMIAEHLATTRSDVKATAGEMVQDLCHTYDFIFHSRDPKELAKLDFPGRRKYIEFLRETREAVYGTKDIEPGEERLLVDRKAIVADLEEDLKSIEECLTSLSSSDCTNLTADSGSFLLIDGKTKLPLDYIRKPLVPFEELHRSRFQAEVIDAEAEDANPYRLLPFSGQHKEQASLLGPKDTFFTFNTRLRNGLRLRLEVPVPDVRNTLLGTGNRKYYGAVITDLDENYIDELKSRATVKTFNFKSGIELLKDAMRLKYESLLIQGQMVRMKIYDRMNDNHWEDMNKTKFLYEGLFAKWEKKEYNAAMSMVYQVKKYYETTDILKRQHRDLERELMMLNMDIVFIEGHWIRCIMLQNFHYLLGDQEWRMENDWIHRVPITKTNEIEEGLEEQEIELEEEEGEFELEPYDQSIAKRSIVNIRVRDKDDAWAIRAFYYDVYMQNLHPILQVFPDADSFLLGIENLKNKTFVLLLEMHFTLSIHTELQGRLETFIDWCAKDLKEKQEYVSRKSAKKYFMEDRAIEMEARVYSFLDKPIEQSFADDEFNKHRSIIAEVWRRIVPNTVRGSGDGMANPADMVAAISDVVMEILGKFEHMDIAKVRTIEGNLRKRRRYLEKLSAQAYQVERRIEMEMKKVKRNLEPPYKPPKRVGRLPRLFLKKPVKEQPIPPVVVSEHTKFFVRAFKEADDPGDTFARDSLMIVDTMQEQIVPFYFDHFLKIHGYTPNYNFKTNIELRDGPEINRFRVRDVIPDVLQKLENWEFTRKKIMDENIQRNPKMYENIM
ncbi:uncharacterized protein LOC115624895 [Scaptodrosophila lebanonensis]|uniref:Uncharacterized protein LOC115624895 n=1 Tax=Drosophila lebanonensis TaxID=7225 RepID=A0A6J2TKQ7_DROLE|nr:uncharacterized protein LOC115624895 [Scaptodrosophila lebanonensis]